MAERDIVNVVGNPDVCSVEAGQPALGTEVVGLLGIGAQAVPPRQTEGLRPSVSRAVAKTVGDTFFKSNLQGVVVRAADRNDVIDPCPRLVKAHVGCGDAGSARVGSILCACDTWVEVITRGGTGLVD